MVHNKRNNQYPITSKKTHRQHFHIIIAISFNLPETPKILVQILIMESDFRVVAQLDPSTVIVLT